MFLKNNLAISVKLKTYLPFDPEIILLRMDHTEAAFEREETYAQVGLLGIICYRTTVRIVRQGKRGWVNHGISIQ